MRKFLVMVLIFILVLSFAACKTNPPIEEKGQGVPEGIIESEGNTDNEWHQNEFTKQIPEPDGTIIEGTIINNICTMSVEIEEATAKAYIAYIKSYGEWGKNVSEDTETSYVAQNDKGYELNLNYTANLYIKITKN